MPKLKKRKGGLSNRRKYHYQSKSDKFEGLEFVDSEPLPDLLESTSYPNDRASDQATPCNTQEQDVQTHEIDSKEQHVQTVETDTQEQHVQTVETDTQEQHVQTVEKDDDHLYAQCVTETFSDEDLLFCDYDTRLEYDSCSITSEDSSSDIDIGLQEVNVESISFQNLASDIKSSVQLRSYTFSQSEKGIVLLKLYESETPAVKLSVKIDTNFICSVSVHRKPIERSHCIWKDMPVVFDNVFSVLKLLDKLDSMNVCCGNPETAYHDLVPVGSGLANNVDAGIVAYREGDFGAVSSSGLEYNSTRRSINCSMLTDRKLKCSQCANYGYAFKKREERLSERSSTEKMFNHSTFKHKDMTRYELYQKLGEQKAEIDSLQHTVWKLKRQYDKAISLEGVTVQDHEHQELSGLMSACTGDFNKAFPDSTSRQRLFWEQQQRFSQNKDKRGMRWHPMIIRWCLYIRHKSAKAYEAIKDSGFINLPSSRTLYDYSHFLKSELGFQKDAFELAASEARKNGLYDQDWKSNVGLLFDEIKIKEDLVYDKHSGELIGYCNLGDIGNQMMAFENQQRDRGQDIAKFVLVVMLRSVCTSLCFPLCAFATKSITGDFLYTILWQTVGIIQSQLKLRVLFLTGDGATPNRRFFNMHRVGNEEVVYRTKNPFNDGSQFIYFISDVPHLIKYNLSNSYSHNKTRQLWRNGKDVSWLHIVRFFEEHCELNMYNPCPKLSRKHIHLAAFNYMKVNLAAQVISDSVANAIEEFYGPETSETIHFLRIFNKFFDCLNVRSMWEGRNKRNENLSPYTSTDDPRLAFLTEEVIEYLNGWQQQINDRPGNFTKTQRSSMLLSYQTVNGVKISANAISECVKTLLRQGATYVLTHCFNQDPLEQYFGHYRHKSGANNNPSVYEVRNTLTTLRAVKSQAIPPKRGNVQRGYVDIENVDPSKLPKLSRKK